MFLVIFRMTSILSIQNVTVTEGVGGCPYPSLTNALEGHQTHQLEAEDAVSNAWCTRCRGYNTCNSDRCFRKTTSHSCRLVVPNRFLMFVDNLACSKVVPDFFSPVFKSFAILSHFLLIF